jgi:hypothetical protein
MPMSPYTAKEQALIDGVERFARRHPAVLTITGCTLIGALMSICIVMGTPSSTRQTRDNLDPRVVGLEEIQQRVLRLSPDSLEARMADRNLRLAESRLISLPDRTGYDDKLVKDLYGQAMEWAKRGEKKLAASPER